MFKKIELVGSISYICTYIIGLSIYVTCSQQSLTQSSQRASDELKPLISMASTPSLNSIGKQICEETTSVNWMH